MPQRESQRRAGPCCRRDSGGVRGCGCCGHDFVRMWVCGVCESLVLRYASAYVCVLVGTAAPISVPGVDDA